MRVLAERYVGRGRAYLDLSVLHDNEGAIRLYRKLGFTPGRGGLRQAEEPDQHPAVRRRGPPGLERAEPLRRGSSPRRPCAAVSGSR